MKFLDTLDCGIQIKFDEESLPKLTNKNLNWIKREIKKTLMDIDWDYDTKDMSIPYSTKRVIVNIDGWNEVE